MKEIIDIIYLIAIAVFVIVVAINEISTSKQINQMIERIQILEEYTCLNAIAEKIGLDKNTGEENESVKNG